MKKTTAIIFSALLFLLYLGYHILVSIWINIFHSTVHVISICGLFVPFLLFILLMNGLLKTSYPTKKSLILIAVLVTLIPVFINLGKLTINESESHFSPEKWNQQKDKRVWMVDDLIENYNLVGMNKEKIIELLGESPSTNYFKEPNNLVYWLGPERGFISIDSEWLIIWLNQNGIVINYEIMRD